MSGLRDWVRDCIVNCKTSGKLNPANAAEVLTEKLAEHLDEDGGGLPEGGEPNKQLVTDGEGNAVWEDRLAYKKAELVELFPETAVEVVKNQYIGPCVILPDDVRIQVTTPGELFVVTIDGVAYENAVHKDATGIDILGVGNLEIAYGQYGADDPQGAGMPFLILDNADNVRFESASWIGAHTLKIEKWANAVKTIDPEYLPEGAGGGNVFVVHWDMNTSTYDCEFSDILAARAKGKIVFLQGFYENYHGVDTMPLIAPFNTRASQWPNEESVVFGAYYESSESYAYFRVRLKSDGTFVDESIEG